MQFSVSELLVARYQRDGIRRALNLSSAECGERCLLWEGDGRHRRREP